jgi:hypothetical protein
MELPLYWCQQIGYIRGMDIPSELRLSTLRAFLGRIYPEMRLIKVKKTGRDILLTVILDRASTAEVHAAISLAATEIVADFDNAHIQEVVEVSTSALLKENILVEGWVHRRAE